MPPLPETRYGLAYFRKVYAHYKDVGFPEFYQKLRSMSEIRFGTLVGEDKFGNKYFENKDYQYRAILVVLDFVVRAVWTTSMSVYDQSSAFCAERQRWYEPGFYGFHDQSARGWPTADNNNSIPPDWHGWLHGYQEKNPNNVRLCILQPPSYR